MGPEMLRTSLIEDLNLLACAEAQERFGDDLERAREALTRLRWIDTTQLSRYREQGWLDTYEVNLIEQFFRFARERLTPIPETDDAVEFARSDPGWAMVRERALELLIALDAFIDIDVPGWGQQYKPAD